MRRLLSLLLLFFITAQLSAAPHAGEFFTFKQPDGSSVEVRVWGDEFYQRVESLNGYTLIRDENGWITYADVTADGSKLISTGERYTGSSRSTAPDHGKIGVKLSGEARLAAVKSSPFYLGEKSRSSRALIKDPVLGPVVGLTILIDFSDQSSAIPAATLEDFLNKKGFNQYSCVGSVRDYYSDVSGGKVDYTNIVTAFYRAKKPKSYYDANEQAGAKAIELIKEAVNGVKNQVDFSKLTKRNGAAIALNVLYAGDPTYGWAKGLWPHQFQLNNYSVGGYTFDKYQITNISNSLKLSTFCHENGHMVGQWPDLYDYKSDGTGASGVGSYGLMCFMGDPKNPVPPNAYFRYLVGWDELTDITTTPEGTLLTLNSNKNEAYIYKNKYNSREKFVIESRINEGRSQSLPSEGMLIWHIDESQTHNDFEQMTSSQHYMVSLEQADGNFSLEKVVTSGVHAGDASDAFTTTNGDKFTDETSPNAKWWSGSKSGLHIANISAAGAQMTFTIGEQQVVTHTIEASAGAGGSISPEGSVTVADGGVQEFRFNVEDGYVVEDVKVNGTSEGSAPTYTFRNVTSNQTIHVTFAVDNSLLITSPNGGEELALGKPFTITWSGEITSGAKLELLRNGSVVEVIAEDVTGSEYIWNIPSDIAESSSYTIKISEGSESDKSDATFAIKDIIISDNLLTFADWYVIQDSYSGEQASDAKLDTTGLTDGWIGGEFLIGKKDTVNEIYPYASLVTELKDTIPNVTALTVTYKSSENYNVVLDQEGIDTLGESYLAELPASGNSWKTVMVSIDDFKQPTWIGANTTPLDLSKVNSISFSINDSYGINTDFKVKNLQLYGYEYVEPVAINQTIVNSANALTITGINRESLQLSVKHAGSYKVELFNLAGRKIAVSQSDLTVGMNNVPFSTSLASQVYILRISSNQATTLQRIVVK